MKKKALKQDFRREIKNTLNRFLSILFIVAMGVAFFSGIQSSAPDMRATGDYYFDENNLMDIRVISTLGLTEGDLRALESVTGVSTVDGCYTEDVYCGEDEKSQVLHVESIAEHMNQLTAVTGRLPEQSGECFLDAAFARKNGYKEGDRLRVQVSSEEDTLLCVTEFTVCGIGHSPAYLAFERGSTTLGNGSLSGFVYVVPEDFDSEVYTVAYVQAEGAKETMAYTKEYTDLVDPVFARIESIADVRCEIRYQEILEEASGKIADARQEVTDGWNELKDAKQELEKGRREAESELAEAESELAEGESELEAGRLELEDAKAEVADGEQQISDGELQIQSNETTLADASTQLAAALSKLNSGESEYLTGLGEFENLSEAGEAELTAAQAEIDAGRTQVAAGWQQYYINQSLITSGETELAAATAQLEAGQTAYNTGLADYETSLSQYEAGMAQYTTGETAYTAALADYQTGLAAYEAGLPDLETLQSTYDTDAAAYTLAESDYNAAVSTQASLQTSIVTKSAEAETAATTYNDKAAEIPGLVATLRATQSTAAANQAALQGQSLEKAAARDEKSASLAAKQAEYSNQQGIVDSETASEEEKAAASSAAAALSTEISTLQGEIAVLDSEAASLQTQADEQGSQAATAGSQADALEQELASALADRDNKNAEVQAMQSQLDTLAVEIPLKLETMNTKSSTMAVSKTAYDTKKTSMDEIKAGLDAANTQLTTTKTGLDASYLQLTATKTQLDAAKTTLDAKNEELTAAQAVAAAKSQELETAKTQLAEAKTTLENTTLQLDAAQAQVDAGKQKLTLAKSELTAARTKLDLGWAEYRAAAKEVSSGESQLAGAREQLSSARTAIADALAKIQDGETELTDGAQKLEDGWQEYRDGKLEARKKLVDAGQEIADAERELAEAEQEIADAEEKLLEIKLPDWYINDRSVLPDNSGFGENAERMTNIAKVFPVLFFLVAALISLTTMTRMVEEERTQIGTLKALGYSKWDIASKYMKYAFFATIVGSILGVLVGEKVLPFVIVNAYGIMYSYLPKILIPYDWSYGIIAAGVSLLCTLGATLSACIRELQAVPAELMRPPAPKEGKRVFLEHVPFLWRHLSFSWKSTVRNLVRYKKRFMMTVIGIGGCMGLLLIGYGLRDSIMDVSVKQFGELQLYDAMVILNPDGDQTEKEKVIEVIRQDQRVSSYKQFYMQKNTAKQAIGGNSFKEWAFYLYVPESLEEIEEYFCFRDRVTHERYSLTEEGAILSEKLAKEFNVKPGDSFLMETEDGDPVEIPVAAICENYLSHYVYLSAGLYTRVFGEEPAYNSIFYKTPETQEVVEKIGEQLLAQETVLNISYTRTMVAQVDSMLGALDIVIVVLIISAGMLAFVVLYNLNNININERKRELATIKVLGFYDGEVGAYVYRENILLTIFGAVLGVFLGKFLHGFIITTVEVDACMFGRNINFDSFVYGVLFTFAFSIIVNFVMFFKLKKINMVESLKSIE